ncbi:MAG: polysaccharide biosynthesis/export family protein [Terriglobales bacterium]
MPIFPQRSRWLLVALLAPWIAISLAAQAVHPAVSLTAGAPAQVPAAAAATATKPASNVLPEYVIGPGDVLDVDVWHQPEITRSLPVRPDGRLSLPLVGEIQAAGLTASALQAQIADRLTKYIDHPSVTVMVVQAQSHNFNILGMVTKPGSYQLDHPMTILDAIAAAGGLRDFAHGNHIYLIRKRASDGVEIRFNFNYRQVSLGVALQENVALKPGDTIIVP